MHTTVIELADASEQLVEAWTQLAAWAVEPNPFFEPGFVLAAARHLRHGPVYLVTFAEDDRLKALLPVVEARLWLGLGPAAVRTWIHEYCFLGTPMVSDDGGTSAVEGLLDEIDRWAGKPKAVALDAVGGDGPVESALERALAAQPAAPTTVQTLERPILTQERIGPILGGRLRRERSRLRRRLEQQFDSPVSVVERSGDPGAVDAFLTLEASGWKGAASTAMANCRGHAQFFIEVCADFRSRGCLQLRSLEVGGKPVAMKCNLTAGRTVFCFKCAYDESYATTSPGFQLELHDMECFAREGSSLADSCTASNSMINRLWPDRRRITDLIVAPRGHRGALFPALVPAVKVARAAKHHIRDRHIKDRR